MLFWGFSLRISPYLIGHFWPYQHSSSAPLPCGDAVSSDPLGLALCVRALKLFRAPLLAHTPSAPWLEDRRSRWAQAFRDLAQHTLDRMEALADDRAAELLSLRAASILPEDVALHTRIIDFLMDRDLQPELIRYLSYLSRRCGWMEPLSV